MDLEYPFIKDEHNALVKVGDIVTQHARGMFRLIRDDINVYMKNCLD